MPPPAIRNTATCGSTTPSAAYDVGAGECTVISTISSPNSQRHTSTSCTSESRTIISERKVSGTVLLRCTLCTSSSRPSSPESSISFIAA